MGRNLWIAAVLILFAVAVSACVCASVLAWDTDQPDWVYDMTGVLGVVAVVALTADTVIRVRLLMKQPAGTA